MPAPPPSWQVSHHGGQRERIISAARFGGALARWPARLCTNLHARSHKEGKTNFEVAACALGGVRRYLCRSLPEPHESRHAGPQQLRHGVSSLAGDVRRGSGASRRWSGATLHTLDDPWSRIGTQTASTTTRPQPRAAESGRPETNSRTEPAPTSLSMRIDAIAFPTFESSVSHAVTSGGRGSGSAMRLLRTELANSRTLRHFGGHRQGEDVPLGLSGRRTTWPQHQPLINLKTRVSIGISLPQASAMSMNRDPTFHGRFYALQGPIATTIFCHGHCVGKPSSGAGS